MKTKSICFSKLYCSFAIAALLTLGAGYSSLSYAAQGCGYGNHMNIYGRCVPNSPGPWATSVPGRPDCWRNDNGALRCYR